MEDPEKQKEMTAKVEEKIKLGEKELEEFEKQQKEADKEKNDEKPAAK